jgi:hypothetical protein
MIITREIKKASKIVQKIIADVEKLEKSRSVVEVFDFKNKWHLVEPHLNDPDILSLLDEGMERFCVQHKWVNLPDWDRKNGIGPWRYSRSDSHAQEMLDKVYEDPELDILNKKYINIYEKMGIDFDKPDMELEDILFADNDPELRVIADNYYKERLEIEKKYLPKPNTYKWYQCFKACFYLAEWQKALANKVFPNFIWLTIQNHVFKGHSTTFGIGPKGEKIIFDILLFDKTPLDEILDAAGVDLATLSQI